MPNKKGFTLIELIATITIMLLITVIVTPNIMKYFERGNNSKYEILESQILTAAESYYLKHKDDGTSIPLSNLINEIDEEFKDDNGNIINPNNSGECLGGNVVVSRDEQRINYSYSKDIIACN